MNNDNALLPPRVATLAKVAALESHRDLRMERLLDATRRVVFDDTMPEGRQHTYPFEDLPQYVVFAARAGAFTEYEVAAFFGDDRDEVVHDALTHVDACGRMFPIRDERDPEDASLACLDLDTGGWLHFARDSTVEWAEDAEPLDLVEPVTFDPFPDDTTARPEPLWPDTVELTDIEAAQLRAAERAARAARNAARDLSDACARAALERAGVTVHPVYLTRHRVTTVARDVPQRIEIDRLDERAGVHVAELSIRCVGGRTLRSAFAVAGLTPDEAVLTEPDLHAVASVLNLPVYVDRLFAHDDEDSRGTEDTVAPTRYGHAGDAGLEFEASTRDAEQPPAWTIRWAGGTPPAGVYRRVATVLEAKGVAVTMVADGMRAAMVYRPAGGDA